MSTTDPIYITPSTSVVLVNTADYSGSPIVLLPNIDSLGRIITIRDADGGSYTKPVYISTTGGALFQEEVSTIAISSFRITQPYGYLTVTPRLIDGGGKTRYGLMNSFAFPEASDVAFMNIFNANVNYLSTVSTINLAVKQNATIQGNTYANGNVFIGGNIQFISPNANTFLTGAVDTNTISTNVIRAASIFTSTLTTSTIAGRSVYLNQTLEASTLRVASRPIFDLSGSASWLAGGFDPNSAVFGRPAEYAGAEIGASSNFFGIRAYTKNTITATNFSTTVILNEGNFGINVSPTDLASKYTLNVKGALRLSNDGSSGTSNVIQLAENVLAGANRYINKFGSNANYTLYSASNATHGFYDGTTEYKWLTADKGGNYPEKIRFWTSNAATAPMTVDSNGRVGLAYESPREQLDVSGNIRITNNYSYIGTHADGTTSNGLFNISSNDNKTYLNYGVGGEYHLRNSASAEKHVVYDGEQRFYFGETGPAYTAMNSNTIRVGAGRTGDVTSQLDFVGDVTNNISYNLRLQRSGGVNGTSYLTHRGTGGLVMNLETASAYYAITSNNTTEYLRVASGGSLGIGITPDSAYRLNLANGTTGAIKLDGTANALIDNARNRAINGSASAPSYSFFNDDNTGMFWGGTDTLSFSCGGISRFGIAPTGATFTQNSAVTTTANPVLKLENASDSAERILFCTKMNNNDYNNITESGDAGLIYGTTPAAQGFVIAPHLNATSGIRLDSTGNVGICKSVPTVALDVTGDIKASGNITAFSDERVKTDIHPIVNALEKVRNMRGVTYTSKLDAKKRIGVIAQEIEKIIPEVVTTDDTENHYKSVDYGNIVAVLIEAVKELGKKIDELSK